MDAKEFKLFEIEAKEKWGSTNVYIEYADGTADFVSSAIEKYCK